MKSAPALKFRAWTAEDDDRLNPLIEASVSIDLIAVSIDLIAAKDDPGLKKSREHTGHIIKRVWVGPKAKGK
jgi:hypothetical protein